MTLTHDQFAAYDALPIGVVTLREDLLVEGWNKAIAKWSRIAPSEAVGQTLTELFPSLNADDLLASLAPTFDRREPNSILEQLLPLKAADGSALPHQVRASPIPGSQGCVLLAIEDVTSTANQLNLLREECQRLRASEQVLHAIRDELRDTNAALVDSRRQVENACVTRNQFLANLSQEIRTPLTAVKGFAEILLDHSESTFTREAAERVVRNGDHLLAVVNDVLSLSQIESGKLPICAEACSPAQIVEVVCQNLQSRADQKGILLTAKICPTTPAQLSADPVRLRQVLTRLVDNGLKFTAEGTVCVRVEAAESSAEPAMIRFDIGDTGVGVDPSRRDSIFEPFSQGDNSPERCFGGAGLGLAICRRLVAQMGGEISVHSEPGVGSTFSLLIPRGDLTPSGPSTTQSPEVPPVANRAPANAPIESSDNSPPLAGRRVLVAEDGPDNRRLLEYLLTRAGAEVTLVENGQLAVEAILDPTDEVSFDAVVLDMQMPVMDGYTAATTLREAKVTQPIIALTAQAMAADRDKALAAGCDDYATKPIDSAQLIDLLAKVTADAHAAVPVHQ